MTLPNIVVYHMSKEQLREWSASFALFDELNLRLRVVHLPEELDSAIDEARPLMIFLGSQATDSDKPPESIVGSLEGFETPMVLLPPKDDGSWPMVYSFSHDTKETYAESLPFEEIVRLLSELVESSKGRGSLGPPRNAVTSMPPGLQDLFEGVVLDSLPAHSPYSGKQRLDNGIASGKALSRERVPAGEERTKPPAAEGEQNDPVPKEDRISDESPIAGALSGAGTDGVVDSVRESKAPGEPNEREDALVGEATDEPPSESPGVETAEASPSTSAEEGASGEPPSESSETKDTGAPLRKRAIPLRSIKWVAPSAVVLVVVAVVVGYVAASGNGEENTAPAPAVRKPTPAPPVLKSAPAPSPPEKRTAEKALPEAGREAPTKETASPAEHQASDVEAKGHASERGVPFFFRHGSPSPRVPDRTVMPSLIAELSADPEARIVLTGYVFEADAKVEHYRMALRKAENVMRLLVAHGISAGRFELRIRRGSEPVAVKENEGERVRDPSVTLQLVP